MFNNTVIAGATYLAFGTYLASPPIWAWGILGAIAIGLDVLQLMTKTTKIVLPVVAVTGMPQNQAEAQKQGLDLSALAQKGVVNGVGCDCGKPGCPSTVIDGAPKTGLYDDTKSYL